MSRNVRRIKFKNHTAVPFFLRFLRFSRGCSSSSWALSAVCFLLATLTRSLPSVTCISLSRMKRATKNPLVASSPGEHLMSEAASSAPVSMSLRLPSRCDYVPGESISSGSPRRCHDGRTIVGGARRNLPSRHSSALRASRTTRSFSTACTLQVEYTMRRTEGTREGKNR